MSGAYGKAAFCFFACLAAAAAVLDRVAVVVGNDVITESEVIEELRLEEFLALRSLDLSAAQKRAAADRLVDQQLIRQEMEVAQYKGPDPKEADSMLRNFRAQHFRNEAEFGAALKRYGITEDELTDYLLWELTTLRFTDERFHPGTQEPAEPSANRVPPPNATPATQSADRLTSGAARSLPAGTVDEQLDAWLQQARSTTKISYKPEAFQ